MDIAGCSRTRSRPTGSSTSASPDCDAAVEKVKAAGGEVRFGPVDIPPGRFAVVTEPNAEPGVFAVIEPGDF